MNKGGRPPRTHCECGNPLNGEDKDKGCRACQKALAAVAHCDEGFSAPNPWEEFYVCHAPGISANKHSKNKNISEEGDMYYIRLSKEDGRLSRGGAHFTI